ncbi:sulfotransferase 1A1-like [Diadema antillarum]|uniref:sulfotransferase 1A1-like n=1 Tax=Diadema antillarum TaxID=105358 RepID=UPI003A857FDA
MACSHNTANRIPENGVPIFSSDVPPGVKETCYEYRGVVVPNHMTPRALAALENFEVRPDDTFVITYPKSGTTWMQLIMLLVLNEGNVAKLEGRHVMLMVPFLDIVDVSNFTDLSKAPPLAAYAKDMPSPRILKTHCLPDWLPVDIRSDDPEVKVIYVARNPKDAAVSLYHFCQSLRYMPSYESWDEFFELFIAGRGPVGSWFENVLPWWRRRNHPNVLFLKYEDMKKDHRGAVEQVASFMGKSLSDDVIDRIVEASTFSAMKKSKSTNPDSYYVPAGLTTRESSTNIGSSFMRKGVIGDWKNYFTDEQNRRYDELYDKEMADSGLKFQFE